MAADDLVPCFYTGQDYRREPAAECHPRADVRHFKRLGIGKFIESGKFFLFFARQVKEVIAKLWDGPLGVGNALPFAKPHNYGTPLHYEMPMAGDVGIRRHGLFQRRNEQGHVELRSRVIRISHRLAPELRTAY